MLNHSQPRLQLLKSLKKTRFIKILIYFAEKIFYESQVFVNLQSSIIVQYNEMTEYTKISNTNPLNSLKLIPINCKKIVRVGSNNDGGYSMYEFPNDGFVVSIGVGSDISWELSMHNAGYFIYMFDHTIKNPPQKLTNSKFFKKGLSGNSSPKNPKLLSLEGLIQIANTEFDKYSILKIDIEGYEWLSLLQANSQTLFNFHQIVIELHDLEIFYYAVEEIFKAKMPHHKVVTVNPNNYSKIVKIEDVLVPNTLEVTLVRSDLVSESEALTKFDITFSNDKRLPSFSNKLFSN